LAYRRTLAGLKSREAVNSPFAERVSSGPVQNLLAGGRPTPSGGTSPYAFKGEMGVEGLKIIAEIANRFGSCAIVTRKAHSTNDTLDQVEHNTPTFVQDSRGVHAEFFVAGSVGPGRARQAGALLKRGMLRRHWRISDGPRKYIHERGQLTKRVLLASRGVRPFWLDHTRNHGWIQASSLLWQRLSTCRSWLIPAMGTRKGGNKGFTPLGRSGQSRWAKKTDCWWKSTTNPEIEKAATLTVCSQSIPDQIGML